VKRCEDLRHTRGIMKIRSTIVDLIAILEIEGSLSSEVKMDFDAEINQFIDKPLNLILDLSKVTFIDSAILGSIVRFYSIYRKNGRQLHLASINKQIYDVFQLTGINKQITIFDFPQNAVDFIRGK
jgi:anti-sigma B factor antagonist